MTLPYCCHIISQIEIEYNSPSELPKWLIHLFKNPRNNLNFLNYKDLFVTSTKNVDLRQLYSICDSYLQNFGVSMRHLYKLSEESENSVLPICDIKTDKEATDDDNYIKPSYLSDSEANISLKTGNEYKLENNDIVKSQLTSMISRSMVYYLSLYDEFSKNYDLLNITKKSFTISKNSTYEMISGLRDCISQFNESSGHEKEAIVITNEYSGIFSSNEILITRSSITFRENLKRKGISYSTIYDEIKLHQKKAPRVKRHHKDFSNIVNSYLTNDFKSGIKRTSLYESEDDYQYAAKYNHDPKAYFLNSLRLPVSDEYDMNVIRISGRSDCHKLLNQLDKSCMNNLLSQNSEKSSFVRLILANFPTLFSKVNQARVGFSNENGVSKITIMGLIMPSALMHSFNILKLLESNRMVNSPTMKLKYNVTFDDEMYEKNLRISENKIYDHFLKNFGSIRKKYTPTYKAFKKLVPFNRFTVHKGSVSISPKSINMKTKTEDDNKLPLDNKPSFGTGTELVVKENLASSEIVLVRDTLYFSLSKTSLYLSNIEKIRFTVNRSTMAFLDDSFNKVYYANLRDLSFEDSSKCYIDLYPNNINTVRASVNSNIDNNGLIEDHLTSVLSHVLPHNFANVIWVLSYLLHCSGYSEFFDKKALHNITNYDVFKVNVSENSLESPRDTGRFDVLKSLNFPLSQQSYIVHLVNHINFNKQFEAIFKVKYLNYLNRENLSLNLKEAENMEVMESVMNLTNGWNSYFMQKSQELKLKQQKQLSNGIKSPTKDKREDKGDKNGIDISGGQNNKADNTLRNGDVNKKDVSMSDYIYVDGKLTHLNNSEPAKGQFSVDFGTVYTSSRKHGRVHQCAFDFDSSTTLEEMFNNGTDRILEEFNNIIRRETVAKCSDTTHYILVFMFSNEPTIEECVNLKMLKNVVNSNLIKFSAEPMSYNTLDLNQLINSNVSKFIKVFTANEFSSGLEICKKNSVSYSLVSSDVSLSDLSLLLNQVDKRAKLKMISFPLLEASLELFSKSCMKLIKIVNTLRSEYQINLEFVNITWIYEAYVEGLMDLNSIPDEYILPYMMVNSSQYSLQDFSIQHFREDSSSQYRLEMDELSEFSNTQQRLQSQDSNTEFLSQLTSYGLGPNVSSADTLMVLEDSLRDDTSPLSFRECYFNMKQLWGWSVYVLNEPELAISEQECILYRKHCGIRVKSLESLEEIKMDIERSVLEALSRFNIDERDVEEHFTHDRILTNTVIISSEGSAATSVDECTAQMVPTQIRSKRICFGGYPGIPVLSYKWLLEIINSNICKI